MSPLVVRPTPLGRGLAFAAVFWVSLAAVADHAWAGSGMVTITPTAGRKIKNGLMLEIDTRGVDAHGYRPVRIKAVPVPAGPAPADRSLRIVLYPNRYDAFNGYDQAVTGKLELAAGSLSASTIVRVPQDDVWNNLYVEVFEDGRLLEDLTTVVSQPRTNWQFAYDSPAILFIDSDVPARADRDHMIAQRKLAKWNNPPTYLLPDFRNVVGVFPNSGNQYAPWNVAPNTSPPVVTVNSNKVADVDLLVQANDLTLLELLPPTELPTHWLDLSCYDIVFVSRNDLRLLQEKFPDRFAAVRDWLAAGGVLSVQDGGKKFEHLEEIAKLLELNSGRDDDPPFRQWSLPKGDEGDQLHASARRWNGMAYAVQVAQEEAIGRKKGTQVKKPAAVPENSPFLTRRADLVIVAVWQDEDTFPGEHYRWNWFLNSTDQSHWLWAARHGISTQGPNPSYWQFLIPGVGMAPVLSFVALITLFMALIGPVNYWLVQRARRTYLLLLTVPAGALVVTLGLFLYALVTEGLHATARIRSVTHVDRATGRATSMARHSYYASLIPSAGLQFPESSAVYPLMPDASDYRRGKWSRRLIWNGENQQLKSGYLFPRTVSQFISVQTAADETRLIVRGERGSAQNRAVENRLGCKIEKLMVRDGTLLLTAENIPADSTAILTEQPKCWDEWRKLLVDSQPSELVDFNPSRGNLMNFIFGGSAFMGWPQQQFDANESLLEKDLAALKEQAPEEGFVALTDTPPTVPVGITSARQKASFHIVRGDW